MNDVSRACARCRRAAVVARGSAAYCLECNTIMDWADVIAEVQRTSVQESPPIATSVPTKDPEPALSGGGGGGGGSAPAGPDPFAQRLI